MLEIVKSTSTLDSQDLKEEVGTERTAAGTGRLLLPRQLPTLVSTAAHGHRYFPANRVAPGEEREGVSF